MSEVRQEEAVYRLVFRTDFGTTHRLLSNVEELLPETPYPLDRVLIFLVCRNASFRTFHRVFHPTPWASEVWVISKPRKRLRYFVAALAAFVRVRRLFRRRHPVRRWTGN